MQELVDPRHFHAMKRSWCAPARVRGRMVIRAQCGTVGAGLVPQASSPGGYLAIFGGEAIPEKVLTLLLGVL